MLVEVCDVGRDVILRKWSNNHYEEFHIYARQSGINQSCIRVIALDTSYIIVLLPAYLSCSLHFCPFTILPVLPFFTSPLHFSPPSPSLSLSHLLMCSQHSLTQSIFPCQTLFLSNTHSSTPPLLPPSKNYSNDHHTLCCQGRARWW